MAKRRPANRQTQQRDRVDRERRELRARAAADLSAESTTLTPELIARARELAELQGYPMTADPLPAGTPDPAAQARQSAAFEALRSDLDRLAGTFNNPASTVTERTSSSRSNSEPLNTRGRSDRSSQDAADALAMAFVAGAIRPSDAIVVDGERGIDPAIRDAVLGQAPRERRYHLPDTHRILLEHVSMHSVEVHVTSQLLLGNARPPASGARCPVIDTTAHEKDLVRLYGPQPAKLFMACLSVNGVAHVQVYSTYQFVLWKGAAFFWKEIMPRVVRNLHDTWIQQYAGAIPEFVKGGRFEVEGDKYDLRELLEPTEPDRELRRFDLPPSP